MEHSNSLEEEKAINKIPKEKDVELILFYSRKKPIFIALSSSFILILLASPLWNAFKYVIGNPKAILIAFLIIGFVVIVNFILAVHRIIFPKVGVVFNEKGIEMKDESFADIEWEEVADMEVGRKKILYVKMKSIYDFWKKRSWISWRLIPLLERITNEPVENEIEIDLNKYAIKDLGLFKEKLALIKEQYIKSI